VLLGAITAPTLVMVGQDDRLIPYTDGRRFADAIPGARLIVYPGVGHAPMEQIPDKSAADLRAWLMEPRTVGNAATAPWKAPIVVRELPPARPPK
jgi:pimeloyl-ACP methyl ester carboxylesterase